MVEAVAKGGNGGSAVTRVQPVTATIPTIPVRQPAPERADIASLSGIAAQLAARPPVDTDRVAQIKRAVANGTFPILPATIADRLLALRYDWMSNEQA